MRIYSKKERMILGERQSMKEGKKKKRIRKYGIYRYTHMYADIRIVLSHVKEWNNAICANMDGP